jgi:putative two-component system response regulator
MPEKKVRILVSGDESVSHLLGEMLLPAGYDVLLTRNGEEALTKSKTAFPQLILLVSPLTQIDVAELIKKFKLGIVTRSVPVILVSSPEEADVRIKAFDAGVDDFLTRPVDKLELMVRLNSLLKVKAYNDHLSTYRNEIEAEVGRRTESLKQDIEKVKVASLDTIYRLSRAAEYKDEDTGAHVQRMSHYSTAIARKMGMSEELVECLLYASPMHDIGKIGIPDAILKKPGKLDDAEFAIMKTHTVIGASILKDGTADFMKMAEGITISHHEKWNGAGYPNGIKGTDIPLEGRIVAMADVFDALTSERPYKKPFPPEKAFAIISEGKGTHFDPDVVDAFFDIKEEILGNLGFWNFLSEPAAEGQKQEEKLFP